MHLEENKLKSHWHYITIRLCNARLLRKKRVIVWTGLIQSAKINFKKKMFFNYRPSDARRLTQSKPTQTVQQLLGSHCGPNSFVSNTDAPKTKKKRKRAESFSKHTWTGSLILGQPEFWSNTENCMLMKTQKRVEHVYGSVERRDVKKRMEWCGEQMMEGWRTFRVLF